MARRRAIVDCSRESIIEKVKSLELRSLAVVEIRKIPAERKEKSQKFQI